MARRRREIPEEVLDSVPMSRRAFVKRLAIGGFAVPVITTFGIGSLASAGAAGPYPTSKDDCKDGGWNGYFKNQGDCVSYVVTGGRNQPSPR